MADRVAEWVDDSLPPPPLSWHLQRWLPGIVTALGIVIVLVVVVWLGAAGAVDNG